MRQQRDAQRHTDNSAGEKRPDERCIEPPPYGSDGDDLSEQCTEHHQRAGENRLDRPGPDGHRGEAKAKAGETLHEAAGYRTQRDK